MSYPHKNIIDQIRKERRKQGITQTELANLIGCPQPAIVRIENKRVSPSINTLEKICDVLGMDITLVKKELINKHLTIVLDMHGCPNRCKHCWLGNLPNYNVKDIEASQIVSSFKPYFKNITFYSWLREPDFCDEYKARWIKDNELSSIKPQRFELASFYRLVRDKEYVEWLKDVGVKKVQLTLFGNKTTTDQFVGRVGAYEEIIKATKILKEHDIKPRWQLFIYETNKEEIVELISLAQEMDVKEIIVHEGSCDGNNRLLYDIRIKKENIPLEVKPYYLSYSSLLSEKECIDILKNDHSYFVPHNDKEIVINVTSDFNIYFNFTNPSKAWLIGNYKFDKIDDLVQRIVEEDIPALIYAKTIKICELVEKYGNKSSTRVFSLDDYKMYLLNNYLEELTNNK